MTTNKEKADTPLRSRTLASSHTWRSGTWRSTPTKETACAQTEVGRIHRGPPGHQARQPPRQ
uniref:Uncharacterized protein n=1 Tax=Macrostomum lignano TaxID=282301 RepID=A0A1I8FNC0_9PLAT